MPQKEFQKTMDRILKGIPNTTCFIDDILTGGVDDEEAWKRTLEVMERLEKHCISLNEDKSEFLVTEVDYVGHRITPEIGRAHV